MNSFTKGLLTGVFGVVVGLLISGSNYQDEQDYGEFEKFMVKPVGVYQISTSTRDESIGVYETIIDTRTGKVVSRQSVHFAFYEKIE
tara:strand:- start:187 stop:447 length:261 start_codon:yes stop_codon:yes gene_type:complete